MNELGGAAERMGVSREDARRLFEDAREMRESALRDRYGTRAGHGENGDDGPRS